MVVAPEGSAAPSADAAAAAAPRRLNVLIATLYADLLGGVESVVRDTALRLEQRGHSVAVYAVKAKLLMRSMAAESVRVVHDLDDLPFRPDIIHGHFSGETMAALSRLPDVPAVFHCHGGGYFGAPPTHPRIYRYLSITPWLVQRLSLEFGIPESAMEVMLNGVDLGRFAAVREPPTRLRRALFYNNYHQPDSATLARIGEAAARTGIEVDVVGRRLGPRIDFPHEVLPTYDLVFASGISAIEALASGCAVVVIGMTACGELVRSDNFERLRRANFSVPVNAPPDSADRIAAEIGRYSPDECRAMTVRVRREADFARMLDRTEALYADVIDRHRAAAPDPRAEAAAMARYLRRLTPLVGAADRHAALGMSGPFRSADLVAGAARRLGDP